MDISGCFVPLEMSCFVDLKTVPTFGSALQFVVGVNVDLRLDDSFF